RQPPVSDAQALALVANRRICTGSESLAARTAIGAIAEEVVVCATAPTKIAMAEAIVSSASSHGVVVVDGARRPIAFVARARLTLPRAPAERPLADGQDDALGVFDEREPLSNALERLIHDRQRAAITVDAEGRVTGLVWDLDVLRWLARAAHG